MATLTIVFSENGFRESEKVLLYSGKRSDPISDELTNRMRRLFKQNPPLGYVMDYGVFTGLINKISDPLQLDPKGQTVGLAILPGKRSRREGDFNIALEPMRYHRPIPGEPIKSFDLLEDHEYFGRLSPEFSTEYKGSDDRKDIVGKAIAYADDASTPYNTQVILVEMDWLKKMRDTLIPGLPVRFVFGRDITSYRLSIILIGDVVHERLESRLFLDQHDLIPPPPDEDRKEEERLLNFVPEAYRQHFINATD